MPDSPAAPFTFSIVPIAGQQLPPGLSLSSGGTISGTPTMSGTYTFTVKATDADGTASVQQYTMQVLLVPTAASVSVSGRVLTPDGRGLTNATVILTDSNRNIQTTRTSTFGYYRFDEVEAGQTYIFSVRSKRYQFTPQVVTVMEDLSDLNFTAQE
jgi:plastocyanin domain-containing protein